MDSPLQEDQCGICAGDGTKCSVQNRSIKKKVGQNFTKFLVIPKGARYIEVKEPETGNNSLIIRERKTGLNIFDSSTFKGTHWTTISEGTKFQFHITDSNSLLITGRGPLLSPIVVGMVNTKKSEEVIHFKYITETQEDTHSNRHRYFERK